MINATLALIENPELEDNELNTIVPALTSDRWQILGRKGALSAILTGRGSIVMRGKAEVEEIRKGRLAIVVTEIPYQLIKLP